MRVVNVRQLKSNPSVALREAKHELVMVTNRERPDALLIGMEQLSGIPNMEQVRVVMGIALFRDKMLSIGAASKVAGKPLSEMLTLISELGIPVVDYSPEEAQGERVTAEKWLAVHKADVEQSPL